MKFLRSKYLQFTLSLLIGGLSLYLALRNVSVEDFWASIQGADWGWLGLALLSVVVNNLAKAARWQVLAGKGSERPGFPKTLMALLAGQALNALYPARLGDLGRAYLAGNTGAGRAFLLGSIALEKLIELLSYGLLLLLVVLWMPLPDWLNRSVYGLIAAALLLTVAALLVSRNHAWGRNVLEWMQKRRPAWIPERIAALLRAALTSLKVLRSSWDLLRVAFWSAVVWGMAIGTNYLVIRALDVRLAGVAGEISGKMPASFVASCLILVGLTVGISVPSTPGRIGIFQYICVLALAVFGVPQATAFAYGVLLHGIVFIPTTLAGLLSMLVLGWPGDRAKLFDLVKEPGQ